MIKVAMAIVAILAHVALFYAIYDTRRFRDAAVKMAEKAPLKILVD